MKKCLVQLGGTGIGSLHVCKMVRQFYRSLAISSSTIPYDLFFLTQARQVLK
ncbi:MAG: hypothetical protein AAGI38_01030 [Bacteroidota bacterium]